MPGRHQNAPSRRRPWGWVAGLSALAVAGTTVATTLLGGAAAGAAAPDPNYHPGSDNATFTVTGVLDSNCLVSTGGTEVWIKPGDKVVFDSSLVGIKVNDALLGQTLGSLLGAVLSPKQVAGLDVHATIDAGTAKARTVDVAGGKSTTVSGLGAGDHKLAWTATGLALLPSAGGLTVPLSSSDLKSGAALSWTGVVHVTDSAARCKLGVGTPRVAVSVGPVKVTVPNLNVEVPQPTLPPVKLPGLPGGGKSTAPAGGKTTAPAQGATSSGGGNVLPVPARVVPRGDGDAVFGNVGGGYLPNALPGAANLAGGSNAAARPTPSATASAADVQQNSTGKHKTIDLASSKADSTGQFSVILAIVAIVALSVVAATYARLYLLRRETPAE
jgi:hypothetical protein